jgi:ferrous-iron efflux pump FieF
MVTRPDKELIKNTSAEKKEKLLRLATNTALLVAISLVFIKAIAWFQTGSVAMLGSLIDSVLDSTAAVINLFFMRSALLPADSDHRFGHGKAEPLGGMFQAMIIGASALFLLAESGRRMVNPTIPEQSELGIAVMIVSSLLVAALVLLQRSVIKRTGSILVAGDALHGLGDIAINMGVIFALVVSTQFNAPWIDPLVACLLALMLIRGAWGIGYSAIQQLMDQEFSNEERAHIRQLAKQHPQVNDTHDLRTRRAGMSAFIQLHVEMDGNISLIEAHRIGDEVEKIIMTEFPNTEVLIHQDPYGKEPVDTFLRN